MRKTLRRYVFGPSMILAACTNATDSIPDAHDHVQSTETTPDARAPERVTKTDRYDLVQMLSVSERAQATAEISCQSPSVRRSLWKGWRIFRLPDGSNVCWTNRGRATLTTHLARVAPRKVTIQLSTHPDGSSKNWPHQFVDVIWNGRRITSGAGVEMTWGANSISLEVPSAVQRIGPNQIDLLPRYWTFNERGPLNAETEHVGVRFHNLELSESPIMPVAAVPEHSDGAVRQPANSLVTYYSVVPNGNTEIAVDASCQPSEATGRGASRASFIVAITDTNGNQSVLCDRDVKGLAGGESASIRGTLGEHAGEAVAITVSVCEVPTGEGALPLPASACSWRARLTATEKERLPDPTGLRGSYNVFVVLLDALRADRLSPYGNRAFPTTVAAELANDGVTFVNAFSNSSWTRPSVASMFSGVYPSVHQMFTYTTTLPPNLRTLPEELRAAGYATLAVSQNSNVSKAFGFSRGFEEFHELVRCGERGCEMQTDYDAERRKGPEHLAALIWEQYVDPFLTRNNGRPFFVYLHAIDPHDPYDALPPFGPEPSERGNAMFAIGTQALFNLVNSGRTVLSAADFAVLASNYDGEVRYMDRVVGHLRDRLDERGLLRRTVFVVLADHGESFGEHGTLGHGTSLHGELLRVPWIMSLKGVLPSARARVSAQLVDVAPTLLDLVGLSIPGGFQGKSLLPYVLATDAGTSRPTFARHLTDSGYLVDFESVQRGDWKLILQSHPQRQPDEELFNVRADPAETNDRAATEWVVAGALKQLLRWRRTADLALQVKQHRVAREDIDSTVLENLRALGYVE